ncbi:flippase [Maribrevibacterium harenarium]|uniref:Flippase n=1 Tax=Maribrevibacterium harenarium TaxID=2589817 RepID=A0A501WZK6_9GAMM|nr:flippase [Maribrevibacterium harenarium]TPE54292.1 flippase [Maribrevibacterium harenarium]
MSIWLKAKEVGRHRLINSLIWNFSGQILPLLAALICIPILVEQLGDERFGFLSIAWVVIGYFSLFDLGLGRAITFIVAKRNAEKLSSIKIINTALKFLLYISCFVLLIFFIASDVLTKDVLLVSVELKSEASLAIKVLSVGLPFVILSIGLRGVLEAYQLFKRISFVTIPSGILLFVVPAIVSYFTNSLVLIFGSLVFIRFLQFLLFFISVNLVVKISFFETIDKNELKLLLSFGGWMTATNIISPIMVNMDRFFIGAKVAVSAVTNYVVPFDLITKALVLPSAISGVLFPEFSKLQATGKTQSAFKLLIKSLLLLAMVFSIPLIIVFIFSYELLSIWVSVSFALSSYEILKILCVGVFFNGLAYLPFSYVQGFGRSDVTAKLHLIELVVYLPLLYGMITSYGVIGAAYSWVFRVFMDFLLLIFMSFRLGRER